MSRQVPWTRKIVDEFVVEGCLSELEEKIIRTRAAGWSRVQQSMEFGLSVSTVDRIIARLKTKYDQVQEYDNILPPRKS